MKDAAQKRRLMGKAVTEGGEGDAEENGRREGVRDAVKE